MFATPDSALVEHDIHIPAAGVELAGCLVVPANAAAVVVFAHGAGSDRHSPRNREVAARLRSAGFATLLMDLLTEAEARVDQRTREHRFDVRRLALRITHAAGWLGRYRPTARLPLGLFGASTGGGAALLAAARMPGRVRAVVSRGGRPDLAGDALPRVNAPTLLIVGGNDSAVLEMNEQARSRMTEAEVRLHVVVGAGHLFEEPGALDAVATMTVDWFASHLPHGTPPPE